MQKFEIFKKILNPAPSLKTQGISYLYLSLTPLQTISNNNTISETEDKQNSIRALIISDPETSISASACNVSVGTLEDPISKQGLAHLLEHMVFLDEDKLENKSNETIDCPNFKEWIEKNGGYINAFTSLEATNYSF